MSTATACSHLDQIRDVQPTTPNGCGECLVCGHVGCCDSSKNRHATKHFQGTRHPIMRSFEPGENWRYCYVDEAFV